jgi:hypothetical protein
MAWSKLGLIMDHYGWISERPTTYNEYLSYQI